MLQYALCTSVVYDGQNKTETFQCFKHFYVLTIIYNNMEISFNIALNKIQYIVYKSVKIVCSNIIIINKLQITKLQYTNRKLGIFSQKNNMTCLINPNLNRIQFLTNNIQVLLANLLYIMCIISLFIICTRDVPTLTQYYNVLKFKTSYYSYLRNLDHRQLYVTYKLISII